MLLLHDTVNSLFLEERERERERERKKVIACIEFKRDDLQGVLEGGKGGGCGG